MDTQQANYHSMKADIQELLADGIDEQIEQLKAAYERHHHLAEVHRQMASVALQTEVKYE